MGRAYNCSECPSGYDEIDNKCQGKKLQCIITKTLFENRNNNTFTNPCNIRRKNVHGQGLFLLSDINECLSYQTNDCNPDNQCCANTDGGYLCTCLSGFRKHGNRCVGKVEYKHKKIFARIKRWFVKKENAASSSIIFLVALIISIVTHFISF